MRLSVSLYVLYLVFLSLSALIKATQRLFHFMHKCPAVCSASAHLTGKLGVTHSVTPNVLYILSLTVNYTVIHSFTHSIPHSLTPTTRYSTAPFIGHFLTLKTSEMLLSTIRVLPSGCIILYYMLEAQLFLPYITSLTGVL
jgi:hypothetical protein